MASFSDKVHELIQCSVCYIIPRVLPLAGCTSGQYQKIQDSIKNLYVCVVGHVICQGCRTRVLSCPVCRRRISSHFQNIVLGQIAEIATHRCMYQTFGCPHVSSMSKIEDHEAECTYKSVKCPFPQCRKEVQMCRFSKHTEEKNCAVSLGKIIFMHLMQKKQSCDC